MRTILQILWGIFALPMSVAALAGGNCGGWMGQNIAIGQCTRDCTNGSLPGIKRADADSCARYCGCTCELDRGGLIAQANEDLTPAELADASLGSRVCAARRWPETYKMPSKFQGEGKYSGPEEAVTRMFARGTWSPLYRGMRFDPAVEMLTAGNPEGPEMLQCLYTNQKGGRAPFHFWPGKPPTNINAILEADKEGELRYIGRNALGHCPKTYDDALKLREVALKETGHASR